MEHKVTDVMDTEESAIEEIEQYVTFKIDEEKYGVSVLKVQSIIEMTEITLVPKTRHAVEGVINLRGSVVPVINLRNKFKLESKEYDLFTVILIVEVQHKLMGIIVDSVSDVLSIPVSNIQKKINIASKLDDRMIYGVGRVGEELVILINVDAFLDDDISEE